MNPAYSVIFFTTARARAMACWPCSGLLAWRMGGVQLGFACCSVIAVALALITAGLLSSTAHLGRPERAWRAFSQWRSSAGCRARAWHRSSPILWHWPFGAHMVWPDRSSQSIGPLGLLTALMCAITVFCTAHDLSLAQNHSGLEQSLHRSGLSALCVWPRVLACSMSCPLLRPLPN